MNPDTLRGQGKESERPKTRRMLYTVTYIGNHLGKVGVIKNGTELNEVPKVLTYNLENKTKYVTLLST